MSRIITLALALAVLGSVPAAHAQNILFLNKSQGFEHSPIKLQDGKTYAGNVIQKLADSHGAILTETKNGSAISAENLKNYDLLIMYCSGDLTLASKDGGDAMGPNGQQELIEWIKGGGALMAFHSTTDCMHTPPSGEITPFVKTVGAEFVKHGKQFVGAMKVVDPAHPAMESFPVEWNTNEEWYVFKNFNTDTIRVLALLDPGEERAKQELYNIPAYPVIWVSQLGQGKVYFNALGHGEEMWDNEIFQQGIVNAAAWLMEESVPEDQVKPNYNEVVPKDVPKK